MKFKTTTKFTKFEFHNCQVSERQTSHAACGIGDAITPRSVSPTRERFLFTI